MSQLEKTTKLFPQTEIWNDSCSVKELQYCIDNGGVGATTNPVIVLNVLKSELKDYEASIKNFIFENPTDSEDEIAWKVIKLLGSDASKLLLKKYEETNGLQGRISFQTNAKFYNNSAKMVENAVELAGTVVNSQIKAPTSKAGVEAFEEMTYKGISINATVSFTVPQAIAVAEAVERGLARRVSEGLPIDQMNPVCTIMAGRVDDYIKKVSKGLDTTVAPEMLEWAGVAVVKNAYKLYQERGYKTRLLVAAYRNAYHWNQFIGANMVLTIPYGWQKKFANYECEIKETIHDEVNPVYLNELLKIEEFKKAYHEHGMQVEEFEHYGAFVDTMNQFLGGYDELCQLIRKYMVK